MQATFSHNSETKTILIGEPSVGKTSIINQFIHHSFNVFSDSTIGASFLTKVVSTSHGDVNLFIWDTAGQERYRSLIPMYSRNAVAAILVIDVTSKDSIESLNHWFNLIVESCSKDVNFYIAENKCDLDIKVSMDDLKRWADEHNIPLFLTTCKKYETIEPLFNRVAEDIKPRAQEIIQVEESNTKCCS